MALVHLDNMAWDAACQPPFKKQRIQEQNTQEVKCLAKYEEFGPKVKLAIEVEDYQRETVDLLGKLYPTWTGVLQALEDPSQLVDTMVMLSYIDCGCPKLFLTQDDLFKIKWKTERRGKITSSDNNRADPAKSKQLSTDGSSILHQPPGGIVSVNVSPGDGTSHEQEPMDPTIGNHSAVHVYENRANWYSGQSRSLFRWVSSHCCIMGTMAGIFEMLRLSVPGGSQAWVVAETTGVSHKEVEMLSKEMNYYKELLAYSLQQIPLLEQQRFHARAQAHRDLIQFHFQPILSLEARIDRVYREDIYASYPPDDLFDF